VTNLETYGWRSFFADAFDSYAREGLVPARVLSESKTLYRVITECGEMNASLSGRARLEAAEELVLPTTGDWVALRVEPLLDHATVQATLPRLSHFTRRAAGTRTAQQVVAANIDFVFLVMGLDGDFNLRRLERYLTVAKEGGAAPVVVLNKADLCSDIDGARVSTEAIARGVPVYVVSAETAVGIDVLDALLEPGMTVALLGSSGVGKSSLTNRFVGRSIQHTSAVRASDSRGRHTTTKRDLLLLPSGALLLDTPGMRELQLWSTGGEIDAALDEVFDDIRALANECRFRDCRHDGEPGCAIVSALEEGTLDTSRLGNYARMRKEAEALERRRDVTAHLAEKARWKTITKSMRKNKRKW
jgi:ribosome biogenesis GTPase / thiamine phosphate phosphatase